jgi:hypothetical protein
LGGRIVFDPSKSLDDNLLAFKAACEEIDADCAKILFDNLEILKKNGPDRDARGVFNANVKKALAALPDEEAQA